MIKLHFNSSKRHNDDRDTIYLLDEPGSYLHTYALDKLCEQLKVLSTKNKVIYCTHFHNLLSPNIIPINSIRIAEKVNKGKIIIKRVESKSLIRPEVNSAYQPIFDALELKPPLLDFNIDNIVLVEGIYDYYSFKMFNSDNISYFPCVNAASIIKQIPYMIFLNKKYLAVWDNDDEGRLQLSKAKELFGEIESNKFLTLSSIDNTKNTRLEELYFQNELEKYKIDNFGSTAVSFNKLILKLFFSSNRNQLLKDYFPNTKKRFQEIEIMLKARIGQLSVSLS